MTVDTPEHETITNKANRLTIDAPNAIPHVSQRKNCAKPMREIQATGKFCHKKLRRNSVAWAFTRYLWVLSYGSGHWEHKQKNSM